MADKVKGKSLKRRVFATPWLFALIYLAAIPSFALVYQEIGTELRQSTAPADAVTDRAAQALEDAIGEYLLLLIPDGPRGIDSFFVQWPQVMPSAADGNASRVIFYRSSVAQQSEVPDHDVSCRVKYELDAGQDAVVRHKDLSEIPTRLTFVPAACAEIYFKFPRKHPINGLDETFDLANDFYWSWGDAELNQDLGTIEGTLFVNNDFLEKLLTYVTIRSGVPIRAREGFGRFLYFSTVTITTLGYGDIVPSSDRARLLVACESILGILVAGLFINAAAMRAAGRERV
jgi:hypothetical protein